MCVCVCVCVYMWEREKVCDLYLYLAILQCTHRAESFLTTPALTSPVPRRSACAGVCVCWNIEHHWTLSPAWEPHLDVGHLSHLECIWFGLKCTAALFSSGCEAQNWTEVTADVTARTLWGAGRDSSGATSSSPYMASDVNTSLANTSCY